MDGSGTVGGCTPLRFTETLSRPFELSEAGSPLTKAKLVVDPVAVNVVTNSFQVCVPVTVVFPLVAVSSIESPSKTSTVL